MCGCIYFCNKQPYHRHCSVICNRTNNPAYVASKGGIDALTRSMAVDLGPRGIRVNMVAPGYIHTDRWDKLDESLCTRRRNNCPLRQEASAEDIAQAVAFLASDASANICGERLVVDGGCSALHIPEDVDCRKRLPPAYYAGMVPVIKVHRGADTVLFSGRRSGTFADDQFCWNQDVF